MKDFKKRGLAWTLSIAMAVFGWAGIVPLPGAAADVVTDAEWEKVSGMLSKIYGEWTDTTYPGLISDRIPNTALLGNGDVGIASGGNASSKTYYISKSDFWQFQGAPLPIGGVTIRASESSAEAPESLALAASVTASSNHPSFPPSRMTNGQYSAKSGYEGWVSDIGNPQWAIVDMGAVKTFDRIILRHDAAARPTETANTTKAFTLSAAGEDAVYTQIYTVSDNTEASSVIRLDTPVSAQYIRLDITKSTQETTSDSLINPRARIGQLEVYNSATQSLPDDYQPPVATDFYEKQDILNARVETDMTLGSLPLHMETYIAAGGNNIMVTALTAGAGTAMVMEAEVWAKKGTVTAGNDSETVTATRTLSGASASKPTSYSSQATLASRLVGATPVGITSSAAAGTGTITFVMQPETTVYIVTAIGGGGKTYNYQNVLQGTDPSLEAIMLLDKAYDIAALDTLKADHAAWWKDYWMTSYIEVESTPDLDTIMQYYYAAQYMYGCMTNEDGVAPGLYGIWHTTENPGWRSDYHLNYNFIATWYGAFSSNRSATAKSAIQGILDYLPVAQAVAENTTQLRKLQNFGSGSDGEANIRGAEVKAFIDGKIADGSIDAVNGISDAVLYPVGIGPYGMELDPSYHAQMLNGAFSATLMLEYYMYTLDDTFMQGDLYDFLKKVVAFYEAWLVRGEDGAFTLYAGYNEGSWAKNAAVELAMLKRCLQSLINFSEAMEVDAGRRAVWTEMLEGLAPQPTATYNGKTIYALAQEEFSGGEWVTMSKPVPSDGNYLTMESALPGRQIGYYSTPAELQIAKDTTDVYAQNGVWMQNNSFPKVYPVAVNIRYPIETIISRFAAHIRSKTVKNLMIEDGIHGAEKVGAVAAVNDMMLLTDKGVMKLFGNWLADKDASFTRLRAAGAFVVSGSYDGDKREPVTATIHSEQGGSVTVASLWKDMTVTDREGNVIQTTLGNAPNHPDEPVYTFDTEAGMDYILTKGPLSQDDPIATLGDVDGNGNINAADARLALRASMGKVTLAEEAAKRANVNGDAIVDAKDARLILRKALGKIESFPIPYG